MTSFGYWAISGDTIMDALNRAAAGEPPGLIYAELYANADTDEDEK